MYFSKYSFMSDDTWKVPSLDLTKDPGLNQGSVDPDAESWSALYLLVGCSMRSEDPLLSKSELGVVSASLIPWSGPESETRLVTHPFSTCARTRVSTSH